MEKGKKRERNVNFSREETEKLISLIEAHINIIENKKSDALTWQEKEKVWKAIETGFNCSGTGAFRDAKHLKLKYEALKRDTRKKCSVIRAESYKTCGKNNVATPLTPVEQKVKEMIILSVEGDESIDFNQSGIQGTTFENPEAKSLTKIYLPQEDEAEPSTSKQVDQDTLEPPQKKWAEWKPPVKSKNHPALCTPVEQRPFDKLAEGKLKIVELQKKIIEKELEEKMIKNQMFKDEMVHKKELYKLEKEQMLINIEILKIELENKKVKKISTYN